MLGPHVEMIAAVLTVEKQMLLFGAHVVLGDRRRAVCIKNRAVSTLSTAYGQSALGNDAYKWQVMTGQRETLTESVKAMMPFVMLVSHVSRERAAGRSALMRASMQPATPPSAGPRPEATPVAPHIPKTPPPCRTPAAPCSRACATA